VHGLYRPSRRHRTRRGGRADRAAPWPRNPHADASGVRPAGPSSSGCARGAGTGAPGPRLAYRRSASRMPASCPLGGRATTLAEKRPKSACSIPSSGIRSAPPSAPRRSWPDQGRQAARARSSQADDDRGTARALRVPKRTRAAAVGHPETRGVAPCRRQELIAAASRSGDRRSQAKRGRLSRAR
jgi:hypothetical protein